MSVITKQSTFILVIGGGQAGLTAGYRLKEKNLPFEILEAGNHIGDSWRKRYSSLTLFTTREFSSLPGLKLKGDPDGYAGRDEFANYLEDYSNYFSLSVRLKTSVISLTQNENGGFTAQLSNGGILKVSHVIVATGGFQQPLVPEMSYQFGKQVLHFTPDNFGDGSELPEGSILIVGDGASGRDLALVTTESHSVILATGKFRKLLPERIWGKSIWWYLRSLGLLSVSGTSLIGKIMRRTDPFPNRDRSLKSLAKQGIEIMPRLISARDGVAIFEGKEYRTVSAVIWAIGYRDKTDWMQISGALDQHGNFLHNKGISPIKNLYYVGRPWQRNRASALIMGVDEDAQLIINCIRTFS
ncbi:NAD(P)-binding domain-containing protein [Xenorhabdus sp. Flor]|uniref:flavin-containing monooxygenase n=1 Tax=Xenorhabdus cabanillasii TaxID=351673 RepID=UPI00198D2DFF|nr:NAD(P)/FAD-dependent oxidoreductase [Xenorhabdus sp. Flor]MBD2814411.1 NAD(P)-binding domain-containing protein [Xenorhabdus sp. Flor]